MTHALVLTVALLALVAGVAAQRLSGLGLSLLSVPFLALVLGPGDAIRFNLWIGLPINLMVALAHRPSIRWRRLPWITVPALALTPFAAAWTRQAAQGPMYVAAGTGCLLAVGVLAFGFTWQSLTRPPAAVAAGAVSAVMNAVSGMSGPPVALYGLSAGWNADELRGTLSVYFLLLGLVALPSLGPMHVSVAMAVLMVAVSVLGYALGQLLRGWVTERHVIRGVLVLSALGGALTLARAAG